MSFLDALVLDQVFKINEAISRLMGKAALEDRGGVRVTHSFEGTTVEYDPEAPYLTIVYGRDNHG